jgi:hypothetical protein
MLFVWWAWNFDAEGTLKETPSYDHAQEGEIYRKVQMKRPTDYPADVNAGPFCRYNFDCPLKRSAADMGDDLTNQTTKIPRLNETLDDHLKFFMGLSELAKVQHNKLPSQTAVVQTVTDLKGKVKELEATATRRGLWLQKMPETLNLVQDQIQAFSDRVWIFMARSFEGEVFAKEAAGTIGESQEQTTEALAQEYADRFDEIMNPLMIESDALEGFIKELNAELGGASEKQQ